MSRSTADREADLEALFAELAQEDGAGDELPPIIQDEGTRRRVGVGGVSAAPLTLSTRAAAKNGLEDAQIAYCGAVTAHAEAKRALRAELKLLKLCEGVEGRNETRAGR